MIIKFTCYLALFWNIFSAIINLYFSVSNWNIFIGSLNILGVILLIPIIYKHLFCKHDFEFKRNIYGDEINFLNGRSVWNCKKCNKEKIGQYLHEEIK